MAGYNRVDESELGQLRPIIDGFLGEQVPPRRNMQASCHVSKRSIFTPLLLPSPFSKFSNLLDFSDSVTLS
jgi:hypothetical protein